jgi:uncharacterized cofD-like protein
MKDARETWMDADRHVEPRRSETGAVPPLPRVVALGGGTGLPILLQGLKRAFFPPGRMWDPANDRDRLTAIVTVADDGGSSGRIRKAYRVPPPGDIRNCLLALSSDCNPRMAAIFNFRFNGEDEVGGHSLGNLILTALNQLEADFAGAVEQGGTLLEVRGRVFPSSMDDVTLVGEFGDGSSVRGESLIARARRAIRRVRLEPRSARALPEAREAVLAADLIVLGPGSLYTSLIPVLLVTGIADAIAHSTARVVLIMNLMTEPGETDEYTAADHVMAIRRHAPQVPLHDVLLSGTPISQEALEYYTAAGIAPVPLDIELLRALGCRPVVRDLLGMGPLARHDPGKLAQAVLELDAPEVRP